MAIDTSLFDRFVLYHDHIIPPGYWSVALTLLGNYDEGDFQYGDDWLDDLVWELLLACWRGETMPWESTVSM